IVNVILGLTLRELPESQNVNITSIICDEEEEKREDGEDEEKRDTDAGTDGGLKNKTTFYVGGYFNAFSYMDYDELKKAEAAAVPGARVDPNQFIKNGTCNSILKLTITTSYNTVATDYRQQCTFEPVETNANKNNIIFNASLGFNKVASSYYLLAFTAFFDKMEGTLTNINDFKFTTTLNVFDLKTKLNTQVMVPAPKARPTVTKSNYNYQCIAVVQDVRSKNDIVVMSYTANIGGINGAYSFTCGLKMEAPLRVVESKCNDQAVTSHYNSNSDMCGIENQSGNQIDLYVAHEEIRVAEHNVEQILYPLTVKSNYQEIGNWNLGFVNSEPVSDSSSISNETETFFRFVDSIMELSKIFKEYPSTTLFLQNIDYRDKNEKITNNTLYEMYGDLELKTSVNPNLIRDPKVISIEYSCNEVFLKLNFMLHIWSIMISSSIQFNDLGNEDANNIALFNNIKNFYDSFIFLLIYAGCVNLAQSLCKNYSESILSGVNRKEASAIRGEPEILIFTMVKQQFMNAFEAHCFGDTSTNNMFKQFFTEKAPLHDVTFQNIMICSNPSTYSGIAYVSRRL
ncbi:MAG: hypothetical protein EBS55_11955, partial [Flavobacteriaceae bacterium]|nr:hypothetical protein [Flavobacteriaceae bacterium]